MRDSELLSTKRCEEIFLAVQAAAFRHGIHEIEVGISASSESLTRFSNNAIGQNVSERSISVSVRVQENGRTARASTNRLHRDGISAVVDEAVTMTRASTPAKHLLPLYEGPAQQPTSRWSSETAASTPDERAHSVAEAIEHIEARGGVAAGIYAAAANAEVLLNSRGLLCQYDDTLSTFSITAMQGDSSGWAKATSAAHGGVRPAELAQQAALKASLGLHPREIPPGEYTVILEPAAVLDLVGQIFGDFSATALEEQRSFLNERMEQKLFGSNINIYDDCAFPLQTGTPFDGEGVPRSALTLVRCGVPKALGYSRASAARAGVAPTGHGLPLPNDVGEAPVNIVFAGGTTSLEDMIRNTRRGILVTRFWYIREVEPYDKVMTGMTRDGTFLIENGEVAGGIRNLRFNQSVIDMLKNVEALSPAVRSSGEEAFDMVVPALKANGFRFTEVTRY
ncbi:MAG TPA: TldD/PmbA family protein [Bryobacteraceae bacterium]|nr:TldD/PmbA family protein [Bryobacteraceae bacterium]